MPPCGASAHAVVEPLLLGRVHDHLVGAAKLQLAQALDHMTGLSLDNEDDRVVAEPGARFDLWNRFG